MKLLELCYIEEAKEEFIAKQMGDKIMAVYKNDRHNTFDSAIEVVNHIAQASRKHLQALVNWYVKGQFMLEDIPQIREWIKKFDKVKNQLDNNEKDLTRYNSLSDFVDKIEEFDEKEIPVSNKQMARDTKSKEAEKIYQDNQITVIVPKTEKAACYYGKGTRWCTASTDSHNEFDNYNEVGKLYIVLTHDGRKFQFQFESLQFMDEKDNRVDIEDLLKHYPSLKDAFNDIAKKHNFFPLIKNPTEKEQLEAVKQDGYAIRFIDNPSEQVQLEAVKQFGYAIRFIDNPTEQVQLEAVKQDGNAIRFIDNPSEQIKLESVKQNGNAIEYINNPSEQVQLEAVKQFGYAIRFIDNPSEQVQLEAVKRNGFAIEYIDSPSEQVQLEAVKQDGFAIEYIDSPSEQIQLEAVKQNGNAIQYINQPTRKVIELAYRKYGESILRKIKNISDKEKYKIMNKVDKEETE